MTKPRGAPWWSGAVTQAESLYLDAGCWWDLLPEVEPKAVGGGEPYCLPSPVVKKSQLWEEERPKGGRNKVLEVEPCGA